MNPSNPKYTPKSTTTGIPLKPAQHHVQLNAPGAWSTGPCDCFSDVSNCFITCFCPCITFGQIAEIIDRGSTSCGVSLALYTLINCVTGCACLYSFTYRSKMTKLYNLEGGQCHNFLFHCCCECCALCQEYRELKNRGFDMELGWHGNMEKNQGVAMNVPVVQGGMNRN